MRIAMLTNLYPPVNSGSATYCEALSRRLASVGHEVIVLAARVDPASPEQEHSHGVTVYRLPCWSLPRMEIALGFTWLSAMAIPGSFSRCRKILDKHEIELVHVHNHMLDSALLGAKLSRRLNLPMVLTIHSLINHTKPLYDAILAPIDRYFLGWRVVNRAHQVICPDANVARYLAERFGRRDGALIPYGIERPRAANPTRVAELRARFGLEGKKVILSLGHVNAIRDRVELVRAMPEVVRRVPGAFLLVVGEVFDPRARILAEAQGMGAFVRFAGGLSHDWVPDLFGLADVEAHWGTQYGRDLTSLGVASMEAMSAGLAVVSDANPDLFGVGRLRDREHFHLVDRSTVESVAGGISTLLADTGHRDKISANGARFAREVFSWEAVTEGVLGVYRQARARRGESIQTAWAAQ